MLPDHCFTLDYNRSNGYPTIHKPYELFAIKTAICLGARHTLHEPARDTCVFDEGWHFAYEDEPRSSEYLVLWKEKENGNLYYDEKAYHRFIHRRTQHDKTTRGYHPIHDPPHSHRLSR